MPLYKITPSQYGGFVSYFNRNSSSGLMRRNCVKAALARAGMNPTSEEVQQIIDSISVDSAGINWQCFVDYVSSYQALRNMGQEYADAFRLFDRSGTGSLTRDDISYVMGKLGIKVDLARLFDEVDTNKDGIIDYDEFVVLMSRKM